MFALQHFFLIFVPLFVAIDPAGTIPIFLGLTAEYTVPQRRRIALRATVVAGVVGILFVILGQSVFTLLGIHFADFQIAGGILLAILAILDLLSPSKPAMTQMIDADAGESLGIFPLAVPMMVGPATMTTSLLLVNTYARQYNDFFGAPYGQIAIAGMVCGALVLNLAIQFAAMWYSNVLLTHVGKSAMMILNKIAMILLTAIAVSLIRQGVVSIVTEFKAQP